MNDSLSHSWEAILKASRRKKDRLDHLVDSALDAHDQAGPAATALLLAATSVLDEAVLLRTLAYHLARLDSFDPIDEYALAWVLDQPTDDLATIQNGLSAIEAYLASEGSLPRVALPWVGVQIMRGLRSPIAVALSAVDLLHHLTAGHLIEASLTRRSAADVLEIVGQLKHHAFEEEKEQYDELERALQECANEHVGVSSHPSLLASALEQLSVLRLSADIISEVAECIRIVDGDIKRIDMAAKAGRPAVEIHISTQDESDSVGFELDAIVRRLMGRASQAVANDDEQSALNRNCSALTVYNPIAASYTLGVRGPTAQNTKRLGRYLQGIFTTSHEGPSPHQPVSMTPVGLDAETRRLVVRLIDLLGTRSMQVVALDATCAEWKHSTTFDGSDGSLTFQLTSPGTDADRRSSLRVGSDDVPQADRLEKVIRAVEVICSEGKVSLNTIGVTTERQVHYYLHAARTLGLIDRDRVPTDRGWALYSLQGQVKPQRRALAGWFEDSRVGRSWRRWSKVQFLPDIDPGTAERFLAEQGVNLSANTTRRRSRTLAAWAQELQPYHYLS